MKKIKLFISSPSDCIEERNSLKEVCYEINAGNDKVYIEPYMWENEPMLASDTYQSQIKELNEFDIVVVIFKTRMGSLLPNEFINTLPKEFKESIDRESLTGTEFEYESAIFQNKKVLLYRNGNINFDECSEEKRAKLLKNREEIDNFFNRIDKKAQSYKVFENDFKTVIKGDLQKLCENEEFLEQLETFTLDSSQNPYVGLKSFDVDKREFFFGREEELKELRKKLIEIDRNFDKKEIEHKFLTVLGSSGSGKSSFVKAGVIGNLKDRNLLENIYLKDYLILKPSDFNSIDEFKTKLQKNSIDIDDLEKTANEFKEVKLTEGVKLRFLIFIDQFEELFTKEKNENFTKEFIEIVRKISAIEEFYIFITMRNEFYRYIQEYNFTDLTKDSIFNLTPISNQENIKNIILYPALKVGLKYEQKPNEYLLNRISNDAKDSPIAILQILLSLLYENREDTLITFANYEARGKIDGVLKKILDKTLNTLDEKEKSYFETELFKNLVSINDGVVTRATYERSSKDIENELINKLSQNHILSTDGNRVLFTHETLIENIFNTKNEKLMDIYRDEIEEKSRIKRKYEIWIANDKDSSYLLKDRSEIKIAKRDENLLNNLNEKEDKYIKKSFYAIWIKRGGVISIVLVSVLVAMIFYNLSEVAKKNEQKALLAKEAEQTQKEIAIKNEEKANEQLIEANHNIGLVFKEKAEKAIEEKDFNGARLYNLYALKYLKVDDFKNKNKIFNNLILNNYYPIISTIKGYIGGHSVSFSKDKTKMVSSSLYQVIKIYNIKENRWSTILTKALFFDSLLLSLDGNKIASRNNGIIKVWDVKNSKELITLKDYKSFITSESFSQNGNKMLTGFSDGTIKIWDIRSKKELLKLKHHKDEVTNVFFLHDENKIISTSKDGSIKIHDIRNNKELTILQNYRYDVKKVLFSQDGNKVIFTFEDDLIKIFNLKTGKEIKTFKEVNNFYLLYGKKIAFVVDNKVKIWNVENNKELIILKGYEGDIRNITLSSDENKVAFFNNDKIKIFDTNNGKELITLKSYKNNFSNMSFSLDGNKIAFPFNDNLIKIWDIKKNEELITLSTNKKMLIKILFLADKNKILLGFGDLTIKIYDISSGTEIDIPKDYNKINIRNIIFSSNKALMVSYYEDLKLRLFNIKNGKNIKILNGHSKTATNLSFSPDGKKVASTENKIVKIWDIASGKELCSLKGHEDYINSLSFSPDGKKVASASNDKTVRIWNIDECQELFILKGHTRVVTSISFSPDGKKVASASEDKLIKLWDLNRGKEIVTFTGHKSYVKNVLFSPDGKKIVSSDNIINSRFYAYDYKEESEIKVWDARCSEEFIANCGEELVNIKAHKSNIGSISISQDGSKIVAGFFDGAIKIYDIKNGKELYLLQGDDFYGVAKVSFSLDGNKVISSYYGLVKIWDIKGSNKIITLKNKSAVASMSFSSNGNKIIFGSYDKTIRIWDIYNQKEIAILSANENLIYNTSLSFDDIKAYSNFYNNVVDIWYVKDNKKLLASLYGHKGEIKGVLFSPDKSKILTASYNEIKIWDMKNFKELNNMKCSIVSINSVTFSSDGSKIAFVSPNNDIEVWNLNNNKKLRMFNLKEKRLSSILFSPNGAKIIAGFFDGAIKVYDIDNIEEITTIVAHKKTIRKLSFLPNINKIISGSDDGTIKIWNIIDGKQLFTIKGNNGNEESISISVDGSKLAFISDDDGIFKKNKIKIWDIKNNKELVALNNHKDDISSISFSPDGKKIATGSYDKTIKILNIGIFYELENKGIDKVIKENEKKLKLKLKNLDLKPF